MAVRAKVTQKQNVQRHERVKCDCASNRGVERETVSRFLMYRIPRNYVALQNSVALQIVLTNNTNFFKRNLK